MSLISMPSVTVNVLPGNPAVDNSSHKVLLVGQMTSVGTAVTGTIQEDVQVEDIDTLFGANSHVANMLRNFRKVNAVSSVDVLALDDDAGGTKATATITVSGPATASGTLLLTVGSASDHTVEVVITDGDTANTIAAAIDAALDAETTLPVTSAVATNVVTLTAVHKGKIGNSLTIKAKDLPLGVTVVLSGFLSGAGNPSLDLADVIDGTRYHTIVWPGQYSQYDLDTFLSTRLNVENDILDGVGIMAITDTYASLSTMLSMVNNPLMLVLGDKLLDDVAGFVGGLWEEFPDAVSAQVAAIRALRLTAGLNTSTVVLPSVGVFDLSGGIHMASLPYFNTPLNALTVEDTGRGFTRAQVDSLKTAGISSLGNNVARNTVILGELVTAYKTDSAGNPDTTFKFLESVDTALAVREYMRNQLRARFGQHRLTTGVVNPQHSIVNGPMIAAFLTSVYETLSGPGFVLTQAGRSATKFFKDNLSVSIDMSSGTATVDAKIPVVTQLRAFVVQARFTHTAL